MGTRADYEATWKHWHSLYEFGGQDPTWSDGCNLNILRGHLIHYVDLGLIPPPEMPLPDEVDQNFMAKAEEVLHRAKEALQMYDATPEFGELKNSPKSADKDLEYYREFLSQRVISLRNAISKRDLVYCRMASREPEYYINLAKEKWKLFNAIDRSGEQMSLFEMEGT